MDSNVILRAPSVGKIVNKILAINPHLGTREIIDIVRSSIRVQGGDASDFNRAEVVDEELALSLAKRTLSS